MKVTFNDFIARYPHYKKFSTNNEAKYIFNSILSNNQNIVNMMELSKQNIPALCACINQIDDYYLSITNPTFNLTDDFTKQALGAMVKFILEPFGYEVSSEKSIPKSYSSKFVNNASTYELKSAPKIKISMAVVEV